VDSMRLGSPLWCGLQGGGGNSNHAECAARWVLALTLL
jgi:hypothetical protein